MLCSTIQGNRMGYGRITHVGGVFAEGGDGWGGGQGEGLLPTTEEVE